LTGIQLFIKDFLPGILWWILVMVLTLTPGNYFPEVSSFWNLFSPDKLIHLFIFGVLAFLLLSGFDKHFRLKSFRGKTIAPVLTALFTGILTEVMQAVFPIGREASIYDAVANFAGCFTGYYCFRILKNKNGANLRFKENNE